MGGGSERESKRAQLQRLGAVAAVVVLVAAGVGPSVGVALDGGDSSDGSLAPSIPGSTSGNDDVDHGGEETTVLPTISPPNETSVPATPDPTTRETAPSTTEETTDSPTGEQPSTTVEPPSTTAESPASTTDESVPTTSDVSSPTTTEPPDHGTAEPPGDATTETTRSPTTSDEGDAEKPSGGPPDVGPPPAGTGGSPGVGTGGPPGVGNVEVPNQGNASANRSELLADRTGPPGNRTAPPAARTGPPANHTGPPGNRTEMPGNGTARPGNWTERLDNRTGRGNATDSPDPAEPEVNVTVENASANASVSVDVSESADTGDDVSFSSMNVTPTQDGSFSLNVTASGDAIRGKTPSTALPNESQPLGYLSVDHSIRDENISEVAFTFRVRADRVNDSEREAISLYRFHDGAWNELPTTLVRTTDSHYVYRVRSPGLSEFAAGKKRPDFHITDAAAADETLSTGDELRVWTRIANRGGAHGTFTARLVLDGEQVDQRRVSIAADGMRQTTFEWELTEPGAYDVYVNDHWVSEVTVTATAAADGDGTAGGTGGDGTTAASVSTESTDAESMAGDGGPSGSGPTSVGRDVTESVAAYLPSHIAAANPTSALGLGAITAALLVTCAAERRWRK